MGILWLILLVHTVSSQHEFRSHYLTNSQICEPWSCINKKLGLSSSLPPKSDAARALTSVLPEGPWQNTIENVLQVCYENRTRVYTGTCPGQSLLHCIVDQLINNCPEEYLRDDQICTPVSSVAGIRNMFYQSQYESISNYSLEARPSWFRKTLITTKCCNLPPLLPAATLSECHFNEFLKYGSYPALPQRYGVTKPTSATPSSTAVPSVTTVTAENAIKVVSFENNTLYYEDTDPFDCCDIKEFIQPAWRSECGFSAAWRGLDRLVIRKELTTVAPPTQAPRRRDFIIVPHSCEKSTCVFNKLNMITSTGSINKEVFMKLLDNLTSAHPEWTSAKGRVVTTCLSKPVTAYEADCEVNKVLACTLDVLTENCPTGNSTDLCRHTLNDVECLVSSSKYRPKHRREQCTIPELVSRQVLTECGMDSLTRLQADADAPVLRTKKHGFKLVVNYKCHDLTPSSSCLFKKMGVLNKYGFMDYFKMNDRIRQFTSPTEFKPLELIYLNAVTNAPMYRDHCNSPKKFLNVVDAMLMTCPLNRRKTTAQCAKIFQDMVNLRPMEDKHNLTQAALQEILRHFHENLQPAKKHPKQIKKHKKLVKKPIYNYGILNTGDEPKVTIINVKPKPKVVQRKPLVLLPVYMRVPASNLAVKTHQDPLLRSSPFALHNRIASFHTTVRSNVQGMDDNVEIFTDPLANKGIALP